MPVTKASLSSEKKNKICHSDSNSSQRSFGHPFLKTSPILPDCLIDRASRDTVIFSSDVLTQSSMPLQPFTGKVKFELVVVGRLWILSTVKHKGRQKGYLVNNAFFIKTLFAVGMTEKVSRTFWFHVLCVWTLQSFPTKSCENVTFTELEKLHESQVLQCVKFTFHTWLPLLYLTDL